MSLSSRFNAGIVGVAILASAASANAQQAIFQKDRPDYNADGISVGSFKFKPELLLQEKYDDNIYSAQTNEVEDFITEIRPSIAVESDWNRHAVNFNAYGDFNKYQDETSEDTEDYGVSADARLDIMRETFVTAGVDYQELSEDRGSPDSPTNAVEPTEYTSLTGNLGFYRGLRKVSVSLDAEAKQLDYEDGVTSAGANINNDDRDRDQYRTTLRVGYEFIPNYQAFVKAAYDNRKYEETATLNRDSDGYEVTVGTSVNISGKARGEVYVGYLEQKYDAATLNDIDGAAYGASLLWNPTQITSLNVGVNRSIEETTTNNSSGYIATNYSAALEHELLRNVLLGTNVSLTNNAYESTAAIEREDDILTAGAEVKYLINRNASANIGYEYQDRHSNIANQDYTKNVIMIGLGVGF